MNTSLFLFSMKLSIQDIRKGALEPGSVVTFGMGEGIDLKRNIPGREGSIHTGEIVVRILEVRNDINAFSGELLFPECEPKPNVIGAFYPNVVSKYKGWLDV